MDTLPEMPPRLPGETPRAYSSRLAYLLLGPGRSLAKLVERAQSEPGASPTKRLATLKKWCAEFDWTDWAAQYDHALAANAARAQAAEYQRQLEAHRDRARKTGEELYTAARALLQQCMRAVRGQVIRGEDGREYSIPAMELTPATFSTAMRGLLMALDMEAHALGLDELLPTLRQDGREE